MADEILRTLVTELKLSAASWNNDIKAAQREAKAFATEWKASLSVAKEVGATLAAAGTAIVGSMLLATRSAVDFGDELNDLRQKTGVTVDNLSRLTFAAEQSGSSMDGMSTGLKFLAKNMELAISGSKLQTQAFGALGISSKDLVAANGDVNKVFLTLADRFKELPDGAEKSALALQIFGRSGVDLIPTLNEGSAGIQRLGDNAAAAGKVITQEFASASDKLNDTIHEAETAVGGLSVSIATALMPSLQSAAEFARDGISAFAQFAKEHENLTKLVFDLGLALTGAGGLLLGITAVGAVIGPLTVGVAALGGAMAILSGVAIVGLVVAVGALVKGMYDAEVAIEASRKAIEDQGKSADQAVASLKAHGIAIDTTGMSADQATQAIAKAGQQLVVHKQVTEQATTSTTSFKDKTDELTKAIHYNADAYDAHKSSADAAKIAIEVMDNATKNSTDLLRIATKAHWDLNDATMASADAAVAAATAEIELEAAVARAMPNFAQDVYNATQAQRDFNSVMGIAPPIVVGLGDDVLTTARKYDTMSEAAKENAAALKKATDDVKESAGKVFDDMFIKGESVFESLNNALKGGLLSLGRSIFEDVTGALLGPVKKAFDDFFTGLLEGTGIKNFLSGLGEKLGGLLSGVFGGGADAAGGAAGGAGGAAGGIGGISSSISSVVTAISGVATALSGIATAFLTARLEGTMNAVEANTRFTYIEIKDIFGILDVTNFTLSTMNQSLTWINMAIDQTNAILTQTNAILATGGGGGGTTTTTGGGGTGGDGTTTTGGGGGSSSGGYSSNPYDFTFGVLYRNWLIDPLNGGPAQWHLGQWPISFDEAVAEWGGRPIEAYKRGTDYVPRTGLAMLHKGEAVIPAEKNRQNWDGSGNSQPITIIVQVEGRELARTLYDLSRNDRMQIVAQ